METLYFNFNTLYVNNHRSGFYCNCPTFILKKDGNALLKFL